MKKKSYPLNSQMIVHSLEVKNNPFHLKKDNKKLLGPKVPSLNVIGVLMYFKNCKQPYITFSINFLANYSFTPT